MEEESAPCSSGAPNDWMENTELLPLRPKSLIEDKFKLLFALDLQGLKGHDMYVAILPNQVCMVGLAPSHPLILGHRAQQRPCSSAQDVPACKLSEPQEGQGKAEGNVSALISNAAPPNEEAGAGVEGSVAGPSDEKAGAAQHAGTSLTPGQAQESSLRVGEKRPRFEGNKDGGKALHDQGRRQVDSFPLSHLRDVNFEVDGKRARASIKESGRSGKKQNGQGTVLKAGGCLCRVESTQGECVTVSSAIPGKLLEVNSRLISDGSLLFTSPCREGHLAVLYLSVEEVKMIHETLIPLERYLEMRGLVSEDLL